MARSGPFPGQLANWPVAQLAALTTLVASTACADPLPTHDQNPLLGGFGLPGALAARAPQETWSWSTSLNWGSTALVQIEGTEQLVVDAETRELEMALERRLGEKWSLEVRVPYRYTGGGNLDNFIDGWHDVFGLPEGARPQQPQDRIRLFYTRANQALIDVDDSVTGFADLTLTLSHASFDSPTSAVRTALSVKLPTGKDHWLNSSGAVDASAIIAAQHAFDARWSLHGQAAVTWLGEGDLLPELQRGLLWSARLGTTWHATRSVDLTVELDAHTSAFKDSTLDFFSDALIATVGGVYRFSSGWTLSLGVSEDIAVETSPDVVFIFGLRKTSAR